MRYAFFSCLAVIALVGYFSGQVAAQAVLLIFTFITAFGAIEEIRTTKAEILARLEEMAEKKDAD